MNIKFPRATYRTIVPSLARIRLKKKLSKDGSQQQSQLIFGTEAEIWTQATLVGGERSHHLSSLLS